MRPFPSNFQRRVCRKLVDRASRHEAAFTGIVVCLTVPKSGTHLLMNVMRELVGRDRVWDDLLGTEELTHGPLRDGTLYVGHVPYTWRSYVALHPTRKVALVRDPRDVVTSLALAHFKRKVPDDELTTLIQRESLTVTEVIDLIMLGDYGAERFPGVTEFFERYYLQWQGAVVETLSYEELLEARTGEEARERLRTKLERVLLTDVEPGWFFDCLRRGSDPALSPTFERGEIGSWSQYWTPQNTRLFNVIAPDLRRRLGYEHPQSVHEINASESRRSAQPEPAGGTLPVAVRGEIEALKGKIERIKSLDDHVPERTVFIPLPDLNLGLFSWADDSFHLGLGKVQASDKDLERYVAENPRGSTLRVGSTPSLQPVVELIGPHLEKGGAVHFVDVGCQYAGEAILVARAFTGHRDGLRITALDPGVAGQLVPWNLRLHGLRDEVRFLPVGASNRSGVALLYGEYGNSENCRTVVRMVSTETFSYPCEVVTLDELLEKEHPEHALFLKLDIQGGEWNALQGAQRLLRERRVLGVMTKFVPSVLRRFTDPAEFPSLIPGDWRLYELPYYQLIGNRVPWKRIDRERFADYALTLDRSTAGAFSLLLFLNEGALPAGTHVRDDRRK